MTTALSGYWRMVEEWRAICARTLTDDVAQEKCQAILCRYILDKAISHARRPNPRLRLYADMVVLRSQLLPHSSGDRLGLLAIRPMYGLVDEWIKSNTDPVATGPQEPSPL